MELLKSAVAGLLLGLFVGAAGSTIVLGSFMIADFVAVALTGAEPLFQWETFVRGVTMVTLVMGFGLALVSALAEFTDEEGESE